jgi:hypothetical protein
LRLDYRAAAADTDDLADLYCALESRAALFGFPTIERFYEIGTPASLAGEFLAREPS